MVGPKHIKVFQNNYVKQNIGSTRLTNSRNIPMSRIILRPLRAMNRINLIASAFLK